LHVDAVQIQYPVPYLFCEQMTSSDKDFRFMATNDLMSELQKDSIKLDDDSERKVSPIQITDGQMCSA